MKISLVKAKSAKFPSLDIDLYEGIEQPDVVIRWGSPKNILHPPKLLEINNQKSVRLCNNKKKSRRVLENAGISIPKTYYRRKDAIDAEKFPIIGRSGYHYGGKFFRVYNTANEVKNGIRSSYYSEFVPKDKEYRVYIFFNKIFDIQRKYPKDPNKIQWNNSVDNGIFKSLRPKNWPDDLIKISLDANYIIKMDIVAIDVIEYQNKYYILELNSSPRMSKLASRKLKKLLKEKITEIQNVNQS